MGVVMGLAVGVFPEKSGRHYRSHYAVIHVRAWEPMLG
jgi:hypothetical protein